MIYCLNCSTANREDVKNCMKCDGDLKKCPMDSLPHEIILNKRYKLITPLKTGGMGGIYVAKDMRLNSLCAVKELLTSFFSESEKEECIQRFKLEAEILAKLRHPNLPCVIDYFLENERCYLVMDYIAGEDLRSLLGTIGNPGLEEKDVIQCGITICEVLEYLHSQNPPIIYRDLKPGNIMLRDRDKRIMLVDFGVATMLESNKRRHTPIGTEGFSPPEQYKGQIEPRSDIYALGATLHHLLTHAQVVPFNFRPVRDYNSRLSPRIESVIIKALNQRPEFRHRNASEMKKELKQALTNEPVGLIEKIRRTLDTSFSAFTDSQVADKIKVLLVEDESRIRMAFERVIIHSKDMEVIGKAKNGLEGVELFKSLPVKPDVILMDISMPQMNGIDATAEIKKIDPKAKIIILTALGLEKTTVLEAFRAGAIGYLIKGIKISEILDAIRKAHEGGSPIEASVAKFLLDEMSRKPQIKEKQIDDAIKFDLSEIDFLNLLIELCSKEVTGKIVIDSPDIPGELYLEGGEIVNCVSDRLKGKKALYALGRCDSGKGIFYPDLICEAKNIEEGAAILLAELIKRKDLAEKIEETVTSGDNVFRLELQSNSAIIKLQSDQLYILVYLDGKNTINDIVRKTGRNYFDVAKAIYDLASSDLVVKIR